MEQLIVIYIVLMSVIAIESLILVFVLIKTPAITFLMASLLKKSIMYSVGKDKMGTFRSMKRMHGSGVVKGSGVYELTEGSHTIESVSKIPIYVGYEKFGATMVLDYPAIVQELKESGIPITNIDDINNLINQIKLGQREQVQINIKPYKTYNITDLENMFPLNLSPEFIDAQVQGELSKYMKLAKQTPLMMGFVLVLIVVAAVAIYIIRLAFVGSISAGDCSNMVAAAKCTSGMMGAAAQTIINMTPLG
jgi:hypothetical protein